jgi:hypothetical protein
MVRKNEDFSKARILVFYLPTNPDEVYIQSTIQPKNGPVISITQPEESRISQSSGT